MALRTWIKTASSAGKDIRNVLEETEAETYFKRVVADELGCRRTQRRRKPIGNENASTLQLRIVNWASPREAPSPYHDSRKRLDYIFLNSIHKFLSAINIGRLP